MKTLKNNICLVDLSSNLQNIKDTSLLSMKTKIKNRYITALYGKCSACSCPGFFGAGYTCSISGCGHHYSQHLATF